MVPEWAREPEEYYNSLREQLRQSIELVTNTAQKLSDIKFRLKTQTLPRREYDRATGLPARHHARKKYGLAATRQRSS
jgi:hypothetical protein